MYCTTEHPNSLLLPVRLLFRLFGSATSTNHASASNSGSPFTFNPPKGDCSTRMDSLPLVVFNFSLKTIKYSLLLRINIRHSVAYRIPPQQLFSRRLQFLRHRQMQHLVQTKHSSVKLPSTHIFLVFLQILQAATSSIAFATFPSMACLGKGCSSLTITPSSAFFSLHSGAQRYTSKLPLSQTRSTWH